MNNNDLYSVLGVSKDASEAQIKKAYRKAALKYHPDKYTGDPKEGEDRMREINDAYTVLSDPTKRSNYDAYGNPDGPSTGSGGFGGGFEDFASHFGFDPFGAFRGGTGRSHRRPNPPGEDVYVNIRLSLKDLYTISGTNKTLKYKKKCRCASCDGYGSKDTKECDKCGGTGVYRNVTQRGHMMSVSETPCDVCGASGYTSTGPSCGTCGGTGYTVESTERSVDVRPDWVVSNNSSVRIPGGGSDSMRVGGSPGSLIVTFVHDFDTNKYTVDPNTGDIEEEITIPYYDAILGCKVDVHLPDDSTVKVSIPMGTDHGSRYTLRDKGMALGLISRSNYIVRVRIDMGGNTMSTEEKSLLNKIKNLHNKQ